jgi:glycosyltransferase involved in cell wall biosynthesis
MGVTTRSRQVILVSLRHYIPGYRFGGPVRSIANLVAHMGTEYEFRIVCLCHDFRQREAYEDIVNGVWQKVGAAMVMYARDRDVTPALWRRIAAQVRPDLLYLNSFFDPRFSLAPYVALHKTALPIVVAPRGELSDGALRISPVKKQMYLTLAAAAHVSKRLSWHATSAHELDDIARKMSPPPGRVHLASNLPGVLAKPALAFRGKEPHALRVVFLSRIAPMKNLLGAIRIVKRLSGPVQLHIIGPIDDAVYWSECQAAIKTCPLNVTIKWQGEVPNERVASLLAEYDVFLLPTHGENFGHAIFEALAGGVPVVISDRTPWRKLRAEGVGADLPIGDDDAFVHELQAIQGLSADEHLAMRLRCIEFAARRTDAGVTVAEYREMWKTAIAVEAEKTNNAATQS